MSCAVPLQNASQSRGRVACNSSTRTCARVASLTPVPELEHQQVPPPCLRSLLAKLQDSRREAGIHARQKKPCRVSTKASI